MKKALITMVILSLHFAFNAVATENLSPLKIKSGLYEGIDKDSFYQIFKFSEDGKHQIFSAPIGKAFQKFRVHNFTDDNITCSTSDCVIEFPNKYFADDSFKYTFTPYLDDSYSVLQAALNKEKRTVISKFYRVRNKKEHSTARDFQRRYNGQIKKQIELKAEGISGLWIGTSNYNGNTHLTALNILEEGNSEFVIFINGLGITNEFSFEFTDLDTTSQQFIRVSTDSTKTFSPEIFMHLRQEIYLDGHFFDYHRNQAINLGNFTLQKVR